jgi:hypothetical protein
MGNLRTVYNRPLDKGKIFQQGIFNMNVVWVDLY